MISGQSPYTSATERPTNSPGRSPRASRPFPERVNTPSSSIMNRMTGAFAITVRRRSSLSRSASSARFRSVMLRAIPWMTAGQVLPLHDCGCHLYVDKRAVLSSKSGLFGLRLPAGPL